MQAAEEPPSCCLSQSDRLLACTTRNALLSILSQIDWLLGLQDNKKGKLLKNHTRDIRRDTMGGAGQAEAGLVGRWLAKKSKQNASASRQMADKLVRLSPKSLLTMFKKTSLQPLPLNSAVNTSSLCLDVFQI